MTPRHSWHRLGLIASFCLLAVTAGCGSTSQLVNVWKDPSYTTATGRMSKVLVIGMMRDPVRRRLWEDEFAQELNKRGVQATPSYQIFPDQPPDTTRIVEDVRSKGFDGLIMTRMLPPRTQTQYVPGYVETVPVTRYNPWYNDYVTYYQETYQPGYVETERVVRNRTDMWSLDGGAGKLVWSGTSETIDSGDQKSVNHEVAELIVPELAKQGIIRGRG